VSAASPSRQRHADDEKGDARQGAGTTIGLPAREAAATASIDPQIRPAGKLIQTKRSEPVTAINTVSAA
jgi:hypothetical protein